MTSRRCAQTSTRRTDLRSQIAGLDRGWFETGDAPRALGCVLRGCGAPSGCLRQSHPSTSAGLARLLARRRHGAHSRAHTHIAGRTLLTPPAALRVRTAGAVAAAFCPYTSNIDAPHIPEHQGALRGAPRAAGCRGPPAAPRISCSPDRPRQRCAGEAAFVCLLSFCTFVKFCSMGGLCCRAINHRPDFLSPLQLCTAPPLAHPTPTPRQARRGGSASPMPHVPKQRALPARRLAGFQLMPPTHA